MRNSLELSSMISCFGEVHGERHLGSLDVICFPIAGPGLLPTWGAVMKAYAIGILRVITLDMFSWPAETSKHHMFAVLLWALCVHSLSAAVRFSSDLPVIRF